MKFCVWRNFIKNYDIICINKTRKLLLDTINYALNSIDPRNYIYKIIRFKSKILAVFNHEYDINLKETYIFGFGKAVGFLAEALINILGEVAGGAIIVPRYDIHMYNLDTIEIYGGTHPLPDKDSIRASIKLLNYITDIDKNAFIIFLVSGGGSALFEVPDDDLDIKELSYIYKMLINSGLSIDEINLVRMCLSRVKGGGLLNYVYPRKSIALVISDVVGDKIGVIASSPLYPVYIPTNMVINKVLNLKLPNETKNKIIKIAKKTKSFPKHYIINHYIVCKNEDLLISAKKYLVEKGINTAIISSFIEGNVNYIVNIFSSIIKEEIYYGNPIERPCVLIFGGEAYSRVLGNGVGGPNQELVIRLATKIDDIGNICFLAIDSDGIDGNSPASGGIIDKYTLDEILSMKLNIDMFLSQSNSYNLLNKVRSAIITGSTGLNVNDLALIYFSK